MFVGVFLGVAIAMGLPASEAKAPAQARQVEANPQECGLFAAATLGQRLLLGAGVGAIGGGLVATLAIMVIGRTRVGGRVP